MGPAGSGRRLLAGTGALTGERRTWSEDSGRGNVCHGFYGGAMTNSDCPWEPPLAGTEAEQLAGALDRLRTTFRWKADDLGAAGLQTRIGVSTLTLGGLLKHLAFVEDYAFTFKLRGEPPGAPWDPTAWDDDKDWEFTSAAGDTPNSSTPCGTAPPDAPAPGLLRPWPTADWPSWSTSAGPMAAMPACAGWSAT